MKNVLLFISFVFFSASCQEIKTIYIASYTKDCQGVGPQKCLLIKESPEASWEFFYDQIEGFEYEEGYSYQIKVAITKNEKPLADASSLQYKLVDVLSKEKKQSIPKNSTTSKDVIEVQYQALSRGSFLLAKVDKKIITLSKDRNLKNKTTKNCSPTDWNNLLFSVKQIDIQTISELKAPSNKRLFDGAANARITIVVGNKSYSSVSFDHGSPPKKLEALVNTILSLSESIE